jgi:hypothetical protein
MGVRSSYLAHFRVAFGDTKERLLGIRLSELPRKGIAGFARPMSP